MKNSCLHVILVVLCERRMDKLEYLAAWFFSYRTDRLLIALLCLFLACILCSYTRIAARKHGKLLFWLACGLAAAGIFLTEIVYEIRLPHGLSASYYANTFWQDDGAKLERFFETNGKRVDRFIDFNRNDFNSEYAFSGKPFSVEWRGNVWIPDDGYRLDVQTNMGAWLYVDNVLMSGHHQLDFGAPAARTLIRGGWSNDEQWGADRAITFVWGVGTSSEFYIGVDEVTDYRLVFRCQPFQYDGSPRQKITIAVADTPVGSVTLQDGWNTYEIVVPRSALRNVAPGFFRVKFAYAQTARPADVLKQSQDTRQLSAAFDFAALQKAASATPFFRQPIMSKGLHVVTLKALTNWREPPFIRFVWQPRESAQPTVIPEDVLFPESVTAETIAQRFSAERIGLGIVICSKFALIVFSGMLIAMLIRSLDFRSLLTWEWAILLVIAIFTFGVRLLFLFEAKHLDPSFDILPPRTDHLTYVIYARGFFRGFWPQLLHAPFHGAPLISFYFILCSILFGESLLTIRIVTAAMSTGSVLLVYAIARQAISRPVAALAAMLCAGNSVLIMYDTSLVPSPLFIFLSLLSLYLMGKLRQQLSIKIAILFGMTLGLTVLAWSPIMLILPCLFLWMLVDFHGKFLGSCGKLHGLRVVRISETLCCETSSQSLLQKIPVVSHTSWKSQFFQKIGHFALLCAVMFLMILPVTLLNYYSTPNHPFVLTSGNSGITMWIGNNRMADGGPWWSDDFFRETTARMEATGSTFKDEVMRYITTEPLSYLKLEFTKLKLFWRGYEICDLLPYYAFRENSKILRLPWVNFVLLGPLGVVGMAMLIRRWKACFILYSYTGIILLTTLLFLASSRYRLPVMPALSMFAAYALWSLGQAIRRRRWLRIGVIIGAMLALHIMMNYFAAAHTYENQHGTPMPLINILRYWDLFHTM